MSQKGLRFALKLSPDIFVVQVRAGRQDRRRPDPTVAGVRRGADDARRTCRRPSSWKSLALPTRLQPAASTTSWTMKRKHPDRQIAVLIPELVARRWYHHLLHNKRAAMLKALLLVRGDEDVVVINVPWYLSD